MMMMMAVIMIVIKMKFFDGEDATMSTVMI
jgi:hypothetical protein